MTEFIINGTRAVLPDNIRFTLYEENPMLTRRGEFSLDITCSLENPINARIFKHINRLNNTELITEAQAQLIVDNRVSSGKIIIMSNTDTEVTFQFIAGNSELNYNAKADLRKIWELDWDVETAIDYTRALDSITNPSFTKKFICPPVKVGDEIVNSYTLASWNGSTFPINGIAGKIIMQPYLLYYINKLPSLLGFTLKSNVLDTDSRAQKMYLINSVETLKYADALPNMTIADFILAVENFFNCSFLVDKRNKTITIENLKSNFSTKKSVKFNEVIDAYERNSADESENQRFDFTKISYKLPSSDFFKYQHLNDDVLAKCEILEFENFEILKSNVTLPNKLIIYRDLETMNDYFFTMKTSGAKISLYSHSGFPSTKLVLINKFKSYQINNDKELIFDLSPATIIKETINGAYSDPAQMMPFWYQLPVSSNAYFTPTNQTFIDAVENGLNDIARIEFLETALFTGSIKAYYLMDLPNFNTTYPFSHVDVVPEFGPDGYEYSYGQFGNWVANHYKPAATKTMRIDGAGGNVDDYQQESIIDSSTEYAFTLVDNIDISANIKFIINNWEYIPIALERQVSIDGFEKIVTGTFYKLK